MIIDVLTNAHGAVSAELTHDLEIGHVSNTTTFTITCATNAAADTLAALLNTDGLLVYHANGYNNEFYGLKGLWDFNRGLL